MAEHWFDVPLHVDDTRTRDGERIVIDDRVATIVGDSFLSLWRDTPLWMDREISGEWLIDLPLRCAAHAHPDSRFRWVHLSADFSSTDGAVVNDLSPRDEVADHPIKLTTTYKGGVSFDITALALAPELAIERSREQDVYFPTLRVSGIHLRRAIWTFEAAADQPLHLDRALRLLISAPHATREITTQFTLRARVAVDGLKGLIPLLGRRTVSLHAEDGL